MTRGRGYQPQLDGVRAIAVLMVVAYHVGVPLSWGGFIGVDVFFVLSGYLITSILLRENEASGRVDLPRFWARRALRLYPALMVMVAVVLVLQRLLSSEGDAPYTVAALTTLTYTANLFIAFGKYQLGALDPTWSLALEEQFYLLWPPLIALTRGRARRTLLFFLAAGTLASMVTRWFVYQERGGLLTPFSYYRPDTRAGALLLGCMLALLLADARVRSALIRSKNALTYGGLLCLGGTVALMPHDWPHSRAVFGALMPLATLAAAATIGGLVVAPTLASRVLRSPPFVWVGRLSYSLYLWHIPVLRLMNPALSGVPEPLAKGIALSAAFVAAIASHYLVERPFLRLKDRLEPQGAESPPIGGRAEPSAQAASLKDVQGAEATTRKA